MAVHVSKSKVGPRRIPTWLLGGVLSLILIGLWALYLTFAPVPVARAPETPTSAAAPAPGDLKILIWHRVLPSEAVTAFEEESGLKIAVDRYETLEELQAMVDGKSLAYDLVVTSGIGLKRLGDAGLLSDLSSARLANAGNLDPAVTRHAAPYDPENRFGVIAAWGTLGLAFDPAKIAARLPADAPLDSWSLLFDHDRLAKLADCGVQIADVPRGAFPVALRHLGLAPESGAVEDTEAAARLWEAVRPSVARFTAADVVEGLAVGDVCLAFASSGDAYQARAMIAAAGRGPDLRYVIPREGSVAWLAMFAIPKIAVNADGARRLIDYMLRPEVAARATNLTGLANAVAASALYVKPEIKSDAALSPPTARLDDFIIEADLPPDAAALRERFWQLINTPRDAAPAAAPETAPAAKPAQ